MVCVLRCAAEFDLLGISLMSFTSAISDPSTWFARGGCRADLIWHWRQGELPMDIAAVVSNHPAATFPHTDLKDVAFHHLPVTPETKADQEQALWRLVRETRSDLVVLAHYMQVLSSELAVKLKERLNLPESHWSRPLR